MIIPSKVIHFLVIRSLGYELEGFRFAIHNGLLHKAPNPL